MKILIDEDLSRSLAKTLADSDHKILDARDCGLRSCPDEEVFRFAQKQKAILMTGDIGFSNILKFPLGSHAGIIVLRFPNEMPTTEINKIVSKFIAALSEEDIRGNVVIFSPSGTRIRRSG